MKFHAVEDDLEETGQFFRMQSENGLVTLGVFKVIYGFRVRGGFTANRFCCEFDWCAGAEWQNVERLYSIALAILSQREENNNCFDGIPEVSKIKPFFNDEEFTKKILSLAGENFDMIKLKS